MSSTLSRAEVPGARRVTLEEWGSWGQQTDTGSQPHCSVWLKSCSAQESLPECWGPVGGCQDQPRPSCT